MKCQVIARRNQQHLQGLVREGKAQFDGSASRFFNTDGWIASEKTFDFDGDVQIDSVGLAFDGEYVFIRTAQGTWRYLAPDTSANDEDFDSVEIPAFA